MFRFARAELPEVPTGYEQPWKCKLEKHDKHENQLPVDYRTGIPYNLIVDALQPEWK